MSSLKKKKNGWEVYFQERFKDFLSGTHKVWFLLLRKQTSEHKIQGHMTLLPVGYC